MALGDPYATLAQLKLRLKIDVGDTQDDAALTAALATATQNLEGDLGRQFNNSALANSGATVTYTATSVVDTAATFTSPNVSLVGLVVTSGASTGTITSVTNATTLAIGGGWVGGTPSAAAPYSIPASATARVYYPDDLTTISPEDFSTTAGLIVAFDFSNSGTYSSVIAAANYQLEPLNGIVDGTPGWPYYRIHIIQTWTPIWWTSIGYPRTSVQITAQWGWSAVPSSVNQACLLLAEENFKLKDSPFGVYGIAGIGTTGGAIRIRDNPKIWSMVSRYDRKPIKVA